MTESIGVRAAAVAAVLAGLSLVSGSRVEAQDACGTILTAGATIAAGAAPSPGTVTIDPCAPAGTAPPLPALGTMPDQGGFTGSMPAFSGSGSGVLSFVTTIDASLPGGTYEFTSYEVTNGAVVTYLDPVTIRVQGTVLLEGQVRTSADNATITFACNDFLVQQPPGAQSTGVFTTGSGAHVTIDANGRAEVGGLFATASPLPATRAEVSAVSGDVTILARERMGNLGGFVSDTAFVGSGSGSVRIRSTVDLTCVSSSVSSGGGGAVLLQSFGGQIVVDDSLVTGLGGPVGIEAFSDLIVMTDSEIRGSGSDVDLDSFDGEVHFDGGSRIVTDDGMAVGALPTGVGDVTVEGREFVSFGGTSYVEHLGTGDTVLRSPEGTVVVGDQGFGDGSHVTHSSPGTITVEALDRVALSGNAFLDAVASDLVVRVHGGDFENFGDTFVRSLGGAVDVRAAGSIRAAQSQPDTAQPGPEITGASVLLSAGDQVDVQFDFVRADSDFLRILAENSVELDGVFNGDSEITVLSRTGSIAVPGAVLETTSGVALRTGHVFVESYGGAAAVIDAQNAVIRSADDGFESGNVSLLIHSGGEVLVESFILPKVVKTKLSGTRSKLVAAGFFDTGPDEVSLPGAATVEIGTLSIQATLAPKGKAFLYKDPQLLLKILPNRAGSSRAKFRMVVKGEGLVGAVDPDQPVTLRFTNAQAEGVGTVVLEKGKFKLGRVKGTIVSPAIFPSRAKLVLKGGGRDKLLLRAGFATAAGAPADATDLTVEIEGRLALTVAAADFVKRGEKFVAKNPPSAPGLTNVVVDYRKELVTVVGKNLDLGALPAGPEAVLFRIALDDSGRAVAVRMAPKGRSLVY